MDAQHLENMSDIWTVRGQAVVNRKGAHRVHAGHPWIYKSDVLRVPQADPGFVEVVTEDGRILGQAMFSPKSTILLRMITRGTAKIDPAEVKRRLKKALERRKIVMPKADAFRLVHGEADFLPGIFVDLYGDALVLQTLCGAADALESELVPMLDELISPRSLVIRDDAQTRSREQLRQHVTVVKGEAPVMAHYHEGDLAMSVDLLGDQKTGGFLDQAVNHVQVARYAYGEALDCFTYHGGFALQLARVCQNVTAYDISETALARARANAETSQIENISFVQANVFDVLPVLFTEGKRFDTIVLDPPAFASGKQTVDAAMRAYKEINLRAMRLLKENGLLISCSCSGRVDAASFDDILLQAARDAKRSVHVIEKRSAGPDHPVLAGVSETDYLKCRILMVC